MAVISIPVLDVQTAEATTEMTMMTAAAATTTAEGSPALSQDLLCPLPTQITAALMSKATTAIADSKRLSGYGFQKCAEIFRTFFVFEGTFLLIEKSYI